MSMGLLMVLSFTIIAVVGIISMFVYLIFEAKKINKEGGKK